MRELIETQKQPETTKTLTEYMREQRNQETWGQKNAEWWGQADEARR
jgi:hypothetical protein